MMELDGSMSWYDFVMYMDGMGWDGCFYRLTLRYTDNPGTLEVGYFVFAIYFTCYYCSTSIRPMSLIDHCHVR